MKYSKLLRREQGRQRREARKVELAILHPDGVFTYDPKDLRITINGGFQVISGAKELYASIERNLLTRPK